MPERELPALRERISFARTAHQQPGKSGLRMAMDPNLPTIVVRPYLDTLKVEVRAPAGADSDATGAQIGRLLSTPASIYPRESTTPDGASLWAVVVQDVTPEVVRALPQALTIAGIAVEGRRVFELHVALDAFLKESGDEAEDEALRRRLLDALVRHLHVDPKKTMHGDGMRWVGFSYPTDRGRKSLTVLARRGKKNRPADSKLRFNVIDPDATIYIGSRDAPTMYRVLHKRTDRRVKSDARDLPREQRRVRIEVELRGTALARFGFETLDDLREPAKLERLRKLFRFACPVICDHRDVPPEARATLISLQHEDIASFLACGLWGVLDRRQWSRRRQKKQQTVDGRRVSTLARRALRIVKNSKFNGRVSAAFKRWAKTYGGG